MTQDSLFWWVSTPEGERTTLVYVRKATEGGYPRDLLATNADGVTERYTAKEWATAFAEGLAAPIQPETPLQQAILDAAREGAIRIRHAVEEYRQTLSDAPTNTTDATLEVTAHE